jgi:hypothetical protein
MKKFILSIIFMLSFVVGKSQIYYVPETNNLNYVGTMNDEILSYLDYSELQMYYDCIKLLKEDKDSIVWLKDKYFYELFNGKEEYSFEIALRKNIGNISKTISHTGIREKMLPKPMYLLFITRHYGKFEIALKKFF